MIKKTSKASLAAAAALGDLFEGIEASGVMAEHSLEAEHVLDSARPNAPKYSRISVKLRLGWKRVCHHGRGSACTSRNGVDPSEVAAFLDEATSADYDHLLQTVMKWVEVT